MLNEKPHNDFDWRSRLGELDSLPGEPDLQKNESWDKLHDRLHNKKPKRKAMWYWIAAASLVIILSLPFINYKKERHFVMVTTPVENDTTSIAKSHPLLEKKARPSITTITKHIPANKKIIEKSIATKHTFLVGSNNYESGDLSINDSIKKNTQGEPAIAIVVIDTSVTTIATASVKKKLKVIHINELGQPVEENYKGRYADHQAIYLKLSNQTNMPYSSGTTSTFTQGLLKIKLTPQN